MLGNIFLILVTVSCEKGSRLPEINLQNKMPVQITYRQVLYNCEILYNEMTFVVSFFDNDSSIDEMVFNIDEKQCVIEYKELSKVYTRSSMSENSLPIILYEIFSKLGNQFVFESENDKIYFIKRSCDKYSVELSLDKKSNKYLIEIK